MYSLARATAARKSSFANSRRTGSAAARSTGGARHARAQAVGEREQAPLRAVANASGTPGSA